VEGRGLDQRDLPGGGLTAGFDLLDTTTGPLAVVAGEIAHDPPVGVDVLHQLAVAAPW
jgi:hypothetical protein